jgi:hypothetical protein
MVDVPEPEVQVEQVDGTWFVTRRQPGHLLRTLSIREARNEAEKAEKRGERELAKQMRDAVVELEKRMHTSLK